MNGWRDTTPPDEVKFVQRMFQDSQLPIIEKVIGKDGGAYSNEADLLEPNFQATFFGSNYARLLQIKMKYDSKGLFIVQTGVGSEGWDHDGLCRV